MALVGLKNIHYAKVTADTAPDGSTAGSTTYGALKKIGNAVSVDINPTVNKASLFGDDMAVATAIGLTEVTVTLETTDIPLEDLAILLGNKYDETTGKLLSKGSDVAPYVGIAFESEKHNGGIRCVKLLKGRFAPSQETINTKNDNFEYQVPKIEGTFVARQSDSAWKEIKDVAEGESTDDWYATF